MENKPGQNKNKKIKSYAIRSTRMRKTMKNAYGELYDLYCIKYSPDKLSFDGITGLDNIIVEIGFGMGDATAEIALNNMDSFYIAVDVHKPGIAKLLKIIDDKKINNIRIIEHDAVEVFENMIPDNSLSGIHVFFPDPWPKNRHHKRRLIKKEFIELVSGKIKKGGYIYICTDWEDYAKHIFEVLKGQDLLKNKYEAFAPKEAWRPLTKFEKKGLDKKHNIREFMYIRD